MTAREAPTPAREHIEGLLRSAGLRVTEPRLAILTAIDNEHHADAETIATIVRGQRGAVSKQAVYDALHALTDAGLVRRIVVNGRRALYETHKHDNHHHLVCRSCGRLEDVHCRSGEAPCLHVKDGFNHGYAIDEAEVIYRGLCPACQAEVTASAA